VTRHEELAPEDLEMRKQRRIVIYVRSQPRLAVTSIELIGPSNKRAGAAIRTRYLEKRASALHGGLHWVEIDLLRGGERAVLDLGACFHIAYDRIAADDEAGYDEEPPPPPLSAGDRTWVGALLCREGLRA
jgi:hypothetical protein